MRKISAFFVIILFSATNVFAATNNVGPDAERNARREQVRTLKKAQREAHAAGPKDQNAGPSKMQSFWKKEGERSGLDGSGNRLGSFVKNLNPAPFFKDQQEKYNARKKAAGAK